MARARECGLQRVHVIDLSKSREGLPLLKGQVG
jgi:hypothetical protein